MGWLQTIGSMLSVGAASGEMMLDAKAHAARVETTNDYKKQALDMALTAAKAEGRKPTMTDYFIAAEAIGQEKHLPADQWNAKVYSNLSGQTLTGFQVNRADLEPPRDVQLYATQQAAQRAESEGRAVTRLDVLRAQQTIMRSGQKVPSIQQSTAQLKTLQTHGIEDFENMLDLDGDHCISKLYAEIDGNTAFEKTIFDGCSFHPADTVMGKHRADPNNPEHGVAIATGAIYRNVTLDGLDAGSQLTFGENSICENITVTGINRGHIHFEGGTKVSGIDISGVSANITMADNAHISHVKTSETTSIISLHMGKNAILSDCDLRPAMLSLDCKFEPGATLQSVQLSSHNVRGADGQPIIGEKIDFSGLNLRNVSIDGKAIKTKEDLKQFGFGFDATTNVSASVEFIQQCEVKEIRAVMQTMNQSLAKPAPAALAPAAIAAPVAAVEAPASSDPLAQIRAAMQKSLGEIGRELTPEENKALALNQQAIEAQKEKARSNAPSLLPPLGSRG